MKILHTADWHVGRTIRGRSRAEEHRAVLAEITAIANDEAVDAVIVAGDQFDVQAPAPEAEQIVWRALQDLAAIAPVLAIAGNHDNQRRLDAVRSLLGTNDIHAVGTLRGPSDGGTVTLTAADGTRATFALLPFMHHRAAVRATDLLDRTKADGEYGAQYAGMYARFCTALCAGMDPADVNVLIGHVTAFEGKRGGGEREAHSIERYCIDARAFPQVLDYVALGHLHLPQQIASAPPVRYAGSPLMMDFGEGGTSCSVTLVEIEPGRPARITERALTAGRALRTVRGTLAEVMALDPATVAGGRPDGSQGDPDDPAGGAWLRVLLTGAVPAGVSETVRGHLGEGVVDVRLDTRREDEALGVVGDRIGRPPQELFAAFLAEQQIDDERIPALFSTLLEDELSLQDGAHAAA